VAVSCSKLLEEIRYELKDIAVGRIPNFPDAELLVYIGDAQEAIIQWVTALWPSYWFRTGKSYKQTSDVVKSQASYALPTGCYFVLAVTCTDSDGDVTICDCLNFERTQDPDADGYFLENDKVVLYPTPSADVTAGLAVWYIPTPTRPSNKNSSMDLPDDFRALAKEYAVVKAKSRQEDRTADFAALFAMHKSQLSAMMRRTNKSPDAGLSIERRWWI